MTKAITYFNSNSLKIKEAEALNRLAVVYFSKGDNQKALSLLKETLQIASGIDLILEIYARNNIALIKYEQGEIIESLENLKICTEIAHSINFTRGICIMEVNYANSLFDIGEYKKAESKFKEVLAHAKNDKDIRNIALITGSYASFLMEVGEYEEADEMFQHSLEYYSNIEEKFHHVNILNSYAELWLIKGFFKKGLKILVQTLKIVEQNNLKDIGIDTLLMMAEVYEALNRDNEVYKVIKQAGNWAWDLRSDELEAQVLIERGRININKLHFDEAELFLLDGFQLSHQSTNLDLMFKSLILLTKVYLLKFNLNNQDPKYFNLALEKILLVKEITFSKHLIANYIKASIIHAMLISHQGKIMEAENILTEVMQMAENKGMILQAQHAQDRLVLISHNLDDSNYEYLNEFNRITLSATMEDIRRILRHYVPPQISYDDLDRIFFLTYKFDEVTGPELFNVFNVDRNDTRYRKQINMAGSLYIFSLGQDQEQNQGLFGPFPFGTANLKALVYSRNLEDPSYSKDANGSKIYFIFCIVYPSKLNPLFYHRKKVETILNHFFEEINSILEVDTKFLEKISDTLMDQVFSKSLKNPIK